MAETEMNFLYRGKSYQRKLIFHLIQYNNYLESTNELFDSDFLLCNVSSQTKM